MQLTIQTKTENPFLKRWEIQGTTSFEGTTPSNNDVAEKLAKQMGVELPVIVVRHLYTKFGHQEGTFEAVAYKSIEAKQAIEQITAHQRKKAQDAKKPAEGGQ